MKMVIVFALSNNMISPALSKLKINYFMSLPYAIFVVILGSLYLLRNAGYSVDDSFITYRYAYHLKEGYGLVFNVSEAYYGTTAAGYAAILAVISIIGTSFGKLINFPTVNVFDIPNISIALSTLSLCLIALLLPVIAQARVDWRSWLLSAIGTVFLFSSVPFNEVAGHETYPFLATSLLGTVLIGYFRSYLGGGFFLALAATFRPDAVLLVGIVLAFDALHSGSTLRSYLKRPTVIGFVVIYTLVLGSWLAYLTYHFGSPIPGTMAAKKAQVAMGYWPLYTPLTLAKYFLTTIGYSGIFILIAGIAISLRGLKAGLDHNFDVKPENFVFCTWLTYGFLSASAYFTFNVTFWNWYGVPILFSFFVAAFVGWNKLNRWAELANVWIKSGASRIKLFAAVLPVLILGFLVIDDSPKVIEWAKSRNINQHISSYSEIVNYIRNDSPDGAIIQMAEPGSFGYHLGPKYTVIDELGLITPGVAQALARGDYSWTLDKWHPKYLVCSWNGTYSACYHNLQIEAYEYVGDFNREFWLPHLKSGARLYRLKNGGSHIESRNDAIEMVKNVILGNKWGKVDRGSGPQQLFIHPGATTATTFEIECDRACSRLEIQAHIANLPEEASDNAGSVGVSVLVKEGKVGVDRIVVDRKHPLAKTKLLGQGIFRVVVDNNGDPAYDWVVLTLSQK